MVVSPGSGLIPLQAYLPRLSSLVAPVAVRELDVVAIPEQVTGSGIGIPPRPAGPLPVPAGFRLARTVATRTYTVLVFRSPAPVLVTPQSLAADHLGTTTFAPLVQAARPGRLHSF